ncbi:MAG: aspartyl protease family protein [Nitrospiraceae bacterium]|nr:MAG: aspartyl protease family protein [Nitrospiraceae bacterium]
MGSYTLDIANKLHLDLEHTDKGYAIVVGGGLVKAMRVKIDYITVEPHEQKDVLSNIIDTIGMPRPADGLLGMDILQKFKYHVDFKNQIMEWYL